MDPERRREIARKGGQASHTGGFALWTLNASERSPARAVELLMAAVAGKLFRWADLSTIINGEFVRNGTSSFNHHIVMYIIKCRDVGAGDCAFVAHGDTESEVIQHMMEHDLSLHPSKIGDMIYRFTPDMVMENYRKNIDRK